jgi:bifunctional UDP-N-acetylglucosamine pyrophosphorylase / glucosamine-1-phosphate N-acetyltransferase
MVGTMTVAAVVLAAGKSTRMRSRLPKAAHSICGRPLLAHVLAATTTALGGAEGSDAAAGDPPLADSEDHSPRIVLVLGHEAERVRAALDGVPDMPPYEAAIQAELLGTGDAVRAARPLLTVGAEQPETVLVLYSDTPLIRPETLAALLREHERAAAAVSFIAGRAEQPNDYGRIVRDGRGRVRGIVEARHATPEQLHITEVNSGIYCFRAEWLWPRLDRLEPHSNGEFYLTDLVDLAAAEELPIATVQAPLAETAGVNTRIELAEAAAALRRRILDELMLAGVTIVDLASTFVDAGVRVGMDTTIAPFTTLLGRTVIGENCTIGPHSVLRDSTVGDECTVLASWLEEAAMERGARIGPMSHLRPGAHLASGAYLGNFGEVKNSTIGEDVQMHHVSYIGDATIGARTNVGAGVVVVNYDGERKHHTEVGEDAFLGCDTLLIAPVTLGDGAFTAAGAVVREDVPPGGLAVGVPARVIRIRERGQGGGTPSAEGQPKREPHSADAAAQAPPEHEQAPGGATPSRPGAERTTQSGGSEGKELRLDG